MNYVKLSNNNEPSVFLLKSLCWDNFNPSRTAFVGRIGKHSGLFLIHFSGIMKADDPSKTWGSCPDAKVLVDKFVDVSISVLKGD